MLKWRDISGPNGVPDGVITADYDRTVVGDANPKFTGGWNNQLTYRNFDMSVFVNFVYGNDIYNANKIEWTDGAFPNLNMLSEMKNRFTFINDEGVRVTDPKELAALNENAKNMDTGAGTTLVAAFMGRGRWIVTCASTM